MRFNISYVPEERVLASLRCIDLIQHSRTRERPALLRTVPTTGDGWSVGRTLDCGSIRLRIRHLDVLDEAPILCFGRGEAVSEVSILGYVGVWIGSDESDATGGIHSCEDGESSDKDEDDSGLHGVIF